MQLADSNRRGVPAGFRAGLLYRSSFALIPTLIVVHLIWGLTTANLRVIAMLLGSLFFAAPLSWYLHRRSLGKEAVFFTNRTHPDQEEEAERNLNDVVALAMGLLLLGLPIYFWIFK